MVSYQCNSTISILLHFRVETCEYGVKEKRGGSESKNSSFRWQNPRNYFFGSKVISYIDFLHKRRTVNATYHCQITGEPKLTYRRRRRDFLIRTVLLLHNQCSTFFSDIYSEKVGGNKFWNTLPRTQTFRYINIAIRRRTTLWGFWCLCANGLRPSPLSSFYKKLIKNLPSHWKNVILN